MDILFLRKTLPHEKVMGGSILVYNRVRLLSRRHNVSLLCFVPGEERGDQYTVARFRLDYQGVTMPGPRPFFRKARDLFFSPVPQAGVLSHISRRGRSSSIYLTRDMTAVRFPFALADPSTRGAW